MSQGGPTVAHAQVYMTRVCCTSNYGHRRKQHKCWSVVLKLNICLASSDVVQNDQRSARNIM
eukprot:9652779-Heterocapsa_arctica.AAC.1